jgi:NAD-dependent dihydropyrimidine dehydrogenase PreA subunit
MPKRSIVKIDEELCDGCGLCVPSCAEGALQIIDGKARLVSDKFCDGLGACLGECPRGAITIEERDADHFDEVAVQKHLGTREEPELPCGCPGSALRTIACEEEPANVRQAPVKSELTHWPVQLMLVPAGAPFLKGADILIAADCVPFKVPDFHSRYLQGKALLVGCPKLDNLDFYRRKLKEIFAAARPKSITVLRMEVPCCGGIVHAVQEARDQSAPNLPVTVHTIGIRDGDTVEEVPPQRRAVLSGAGFPATVGSGS